jgi:hypothetical protein
VGEPLGEGGIKAPAATVFADVIVVFGNLREVRLSHDAADADAAAMRTEKSRRRCLTEADLILCPPFSSDYSLGLLEDSR